jgi:hypothetical protein
VSGQRRILVTVPPWKEPRYPFDRPGGLQRRSECGGEVCHRRELNAGRRTSTLATTLTQLPWLRFMLFGPEIYFKSIKSPLRATVLNSERPVNTWVETVRALWWIRTSHGRHVVVLHSAVTVKKLRTHTQTHRAWLSHEYAFADFSEESRSKNSRWINKKYDVWIHTLRGNLPSFILLF